MTFFHILNVGPDKKGRFESASVKVLAEIGAAQKDLQTQPEGAPR
jgi:hypothetical protein